MTEKITAGLLHYRSAPQRASRAYWPSNARSEEADQADDRLGPARGILLSLLLVLPFWLAIGLLVVWCLS